MLMQGSNPERERVRIPLRRSIEIELEYSNFHIIRICNIETMRKHYIEAIAHAYKQQNPTLAYNEHCCNE